MRAWSPKPIPVAPRRPRWQLGIVIAGGARTGAVWVRVRRPHRCGCCAQLWFAGNLVRDTHDVVFEADHIDLIPAFRPPARRAQTPLATRE